ncbi:MAG: hypothetical protein ACREDO_05345 [Methyloceanibacter sp.]
MSAEAPDGMPPAAEAEDGAPGKAKSAEGYKAGKSAKLEQEQVGKVRSYFGEHKPRVKSVDEDDIDVSIGIGIPAAIVLYDLPPDIIVVGGPCPVDYFVWGNDVVLVDSCTRQVVDIIPDVA